MATTGGPTKDVEKQKKKKKKQPEQKSQVALVYRKSEIVRSIKSELRLRNLLRRWSSFWKLIPRFVWAFFIETLLVSSFRYEWGKKFRSWDPWLDVQRQEHNRIYPTDRQNLKQQSKLYLAPSDVSCEMNRVPARHDHHLCSRIRINVGGQIFETQARTLQRYPHSLLGDPERRIVYYDPTKQYYFFDRHRGCFENILYFYQSGGRLICPREINADEFLEEIEFFDLGSDVIKSFSVDEGMEQEDELANIKLPKNLLMRKLWLLLEYPNSSAQATLVSIISVYVILISVIVFCIETEPMFRVEESSDEDRYDDHEHVEIKDPLTILETICVAWFTSELILRCIVCPNKWEFFQEAMNIVDILAILPYVVTWISDYITVSQNGGDQQMHSNEATSFTVIRVIRLVRVFRIFKLSRHVKGMKILGWTLKASFNELGLLIFFVMIGVVLFSSAVYFAEEGQNSSFQSIPQAFFWAVTTMTTVGYGDMVPVQVGGKIVGSLCAIAGVLTLALPVPVMVSNFNYFYNQEISRTRSVDRMDTNHVQMCPYLPTNGNDPRDNLKSGSKAHVTVPENP